MSLLNKIRIKYQNPEIEIIKFDEDVLTSSSPIPMAKLSPEELVEESKKKEKARELTFYEKYPDGLPLMVLEYIDYSKFGAMLKQEQLLPPSYDRRPAEIDVFLDAEKIPSVELVFKSKTSSSFRVFSIHKYNVAYSKNFSYSLTVNPKISEVWRKFAEYVMWKWERGYRFELLDHKRKGEIGKTLMQEDMGYIESIRRMGEEYQRIIEEQHKDL